MTRRLQRWLLGALCWLLLAGPTQGRSLITEPVTLNTSSGQLYGTLMTPGGKHPPVVLIIAGSGPTDRNGNNPDGAAHNDVLLWLAKDLANQGIASLRYDKRGIAASRNAALDERNLRVEQYAQDAAAWTHWLRSKRRFGQIFLVGHSEGALVASLAAPLCKAAGLALLEGAGRPLDDLLRQQISTRLPPLLLAQANAILTSLKNGQVYEPVNPELMPIFRPSVQPYLISLIRHDPAASLAATQGPVLIVQGSRDAQVSLVDARRLLKARPDAKLVLIKDMDHMLRITPYRDLHQQLPSYNNPNQPIAPQLVSTLVDFIKSHQRH